MLNQWGNGQNNGLNKGDNMDNEDFEIPSDFENCQVIIFSLPHYRIPEGKYLFKVGDKNGIMVVKKIKKDYTDFETLTNTKVHVGAGGSVELIPDIYGITALSRITIMLEPSINIRNESVSLDMMGRSNKSFALEILNQLIHRYRCATQQYWIISIPKREIFSMEIGIIKDKKYKQTGSFFGGDRGPQDDFPYSIIVDDACRSNLLMKPSPPLYLELIMNAREFASKEDYRMCILEMFIALESTLYQLIGERLHKQGILDDEIKKRFRDSDIGQVMHVMLKDATGKNLKERNPDLWNKWNKYQIPKIRNDIVHRGRQNISENEGKMVYIIICNIISECEKIEDEK